jgi:YidC/Oxa1 family membrane protein insertase
MNAKTFLVTFLVCFVALCGFLSIENLIAPAYSHPTEPMAALTSGTTLGALPAEQQVNEDDAFDLSGLTAISAADKSVTIGSIYPDTGFKLQLELTSKGAAITRATLSEFDDRDPDNPQPLVILSPIIADKNIYSLANGNFELVDQKQQLPLDMLNWRITEEGRSHQVTFEAIIKDAGGKDIIKLTKSYEAFPESYNIDCSLEIENLCDEQLNSGFELQGPVGIGREGARGDMRKLVAAFVLPKSIESVKTDNNKLRKAKKSNDKDALQLKHRKAGAHFIWAATTNKYFAAIVRPVPGADKEWSEELELGRAQYYDPHLADKKPDGDENSSFSLNTTSIELEAAGQENSTKTFTFQLYLGPKDKDIFEKNDLYKKLSYFQTIDFRGCCCPTSIISPLAFGIMGVMKWMYRMMGPAGNYGVVIMILVFFQ